MTKLSERIVSRPSADDPIKRAEEWLVELSWHDPEFHEELQGLATEVRKLRQATRAVLDAYAAGADLNTLYDVIGRELAPLVEHEEVPDG